MSYLSYQRCQLLVGARFPLFGRFETLWMNLLGRLFATPRRSVHIISQRRGLKGPLTLPRLKTNVLKVFRRPIMITLILVTVKLEGNTIGRSRGTIGRRRYEGLTTYRRVITSKGFLVGCLVRGSLICSLVITTRSRGVQRFTRLPYPLLDRHLSLKKRVGRVKLSLSHRQFMTLVGQLDRRRRALPLTMKNIVGSLVLIGYPVPGLITIRLGTTLDSYSTSSENERVYLASVKRRYYGVGPRQGIPP